MVVHSLNSFTQTITVLSQNMLNISNPGKSYDLMVGYVTLSLPHPPPSTDNEVPKEEVLQQRVHVSDTLTLDSPTVLVKYIRGTQRFDTSNTIDILEIKGAQGDAGRTSDLRTSPKHQQ